MDKDIERLADEIAQRTGEDKLEVIRKALEERKAHLDDTSMNKSSTGRIFSSARFGPHCLMS